ncbi:copper amine oxidase N-terminal domain-containing protein [Intestinimonas butyriciproducens]|uniref:copper amine oxidase N-terminal domain-containing protein n=1 Tax=Intestinimonas butyriciproducens TaxID=1297617 RepID=UPI0031B5FF58
MRRQWKGFVSGIVVTLLCVGLVGSAFAAYQKQATLDYTGIKITLNGAAVTPKDANGNAVEPFAIEGTTYLPVRAVANALGLGVTWDGATSTIRLEGAGDCSFYYGYSVPDFESIAGSDAYTKLESGNNYASYYYNLSGLSESSKEDYIIEYGKLLAQYGFSFSKQESGFRCYKSFVSGIEVKFGSIDDLDKSFVVTVSALNGDAGTGANSGKPNGSESSDKYDDAQENADRPPNVQNHYPDANWVPNFGSIYGLTPTYSSNNGSSAFYKYAVPSFETIEDYLNLLENEGFEYNADLTSAIKDAGSGNAPMAYSWHGNPEYSVTCDIDALSGDFTIFFIID